MASFLLNIKYSVTAVWQSWETTCMEKALVVSSEFGESISEEAGINEISEIKLSLQHWGTQSLQ